MAPTPTQFNYSDRASTFSTDTTLSSASYTSSSTLTGVIIGNTVTALGDGCFQNCYSLLSITIPNTVTSMGIECFISCTSLSSITISNTVTSLKRGCFAFCTSLSSITIPSSVTSLGTACFQNCNNLLSITISNIVTSLSAGCFYGCTSLSTITIPNSVTLLDSYCFYGCTSLSSITIPGSVTSVGDSSFYGCTSLSNIVYANPSLITTVATNSFGNTRPATVNFYSTPSAPNPPFPATGVYNVGLYLPGSSYNYYSGASCYNEGTLILVLKNGKEEYVKIEELRSGDLVKTYLHGYKPIELIGKNKMLNDLKNAVNSMYKIDDIIVTGGHCLLINKHIKSKYNKRKILIDNKYCVLACEYEKAEQIKNNDIYTIYHMVLLGEQDRYGIYVGNGILSESTSKKHFLKQNFILLE